MPCSTRTILCASAAILLGPFMTLGAHAQTAIPLQDALTDTRGTLPSAFGSSVACLAGDAIVGAPGDPDGGQAYVYRRSGQATLPLTPLVLPNPAPTPGLRFGERVMIVDRPSGPFALVADTASENFSSPNAGDVFGFDLAAPTPVSVGFGFFTDERFGTAMTTLGDANADGSPDVLIMSEGGSLPGGRAYSLQLSESFLIGSLSLGFGFPPASVSAGDFDADGVSDAVVGVPFPAQPPPLTPTVPAEVRLYKAEVTPFPAPTPSSLGFTQISTIQDDPTIGFGSAVAVDTGFFTTAPLLGPALAVGAPDYSVPGSSTGGEGLVKIFSYDSSSTFFSTPCVLEGQVPGGRFGASIDAVGDTNGNGLPEFLVGSPHLAAPDGTNGAGGVYLVEYVPANSACQVLGPYFASAPVEGAHLGVSVTGRTTSGGGCDVILNPKDGSDQPDVIAGGPSGDTVPGIFVAFAAPTVTPTPTPTSTSTPSGARPSSAELTFKIDRQGDFTARIDLDQDPLLASGVPAPDVEASAITCVARIFARFGLRGNDGRTRLTRIERVFQGTITTRTTRFFANGLPAVAAANGAQPAVYLAAVIECGGPQIITNQLGRILNCGVAPRGRVTPWLNQLRRRITRLSANGVRPRGTNPRKKRCVCSRRTRR